MEKATYIQLDRIESKLEILTEFLREKYPKEFDKILKSLSGEKDEEEVK
jgi:hypothetical protein